MVEPTATAGDAASTIAPPDDTSFTDQLLAELLISSKLVTPEQLADAKNRLASHGNEGAIPLPRAFVPDLVGLSVRSIDPADGSEMANIVLGEAVGDPGEWPGWSSGQILIVNQGEPGLVETIATAPGAALGLFPAPQGAFLYPGGPPTRDLSPEVLVLPSPAMSPNAVKSRPLDLVASPTGEFLVASNRGAGTVHVLVPNTSSQLGAIAIRAAGSKRGIGIAIHSRTAYITDGLTPRLTILELTTLKARHQTFPTGPLGPVAVTPDGQNLLLTFYKNTDELGLLTVTTGDLRVRHLLNLPGKKIPVAPLEPFRVTASGQIAYLVVQDGDTMSRFRLLAIDLAKKKVAREFPLDTLPLAIGTPAPRGWLPERLDLEQAIVDLGFATHEEIRRLREADPGGPPLQDFRLDPQIVGQIPERMMRTMGIVPMFREGDKLLVAMVNPRDPTGLQLASQLAGGLVLEPIPIGEEDLAGFMADRYPSLMERYHALRATVPAGPAPTPTPQPAPPEAPPAAGVPTAGLPVAGVASQPGQAAAAPSAPAARPAGPVPVPASVRPQQTPTPKPAETGTRPLVKDFPISTDSWVGPGNRVLLVDAMRRQVVEVSRERREVWAYRNIVAGAASYLGNGRILIVDMGNGKILEVDPKSTQAVWTFGSDSDRTRQLRGPKGASRLSNGNTLIADTGNHRVIEVNAQCEIVWSYGELGKAGCTGGSLFKPQAAIRVKNGTTLISDTGNHRVIEVNDGGEVVWQYGNHSNRLGGGQGSGVNQLSEPSMAARLEGGTILLADTGNQRVLEIDTMKQISWHCRPGSIKGGTAIRDPILVARPDGSKTLIAGRTGVIEVDTDIKVGWEFQFGTAKDSSAPATALTAIFNREVEPAAPPSGAQDIPINLPGSFLLVDRVRSRIIEIDRKMQVMWQFTGLVGGERNRIEHPHYASRLTNANTLVADTGHHRVVEVRDNAIVWQFGKRGEEGNTPKQLSSPRGAERTPSGTIMIADTGNRRVIEVNAAQESVWRKDNLVAPVYAAKLPTGNVLIVDWGAHLVTEVNDRGMPVWQYGQQGNNGKGPNQLFHPEHACRLENGNTLITDTQNHRILEVAPDKSIAWQYGGEPHLLGRKGRFGMQMLTPVVAWRLPNGRTMIHHAGANHVIEVDPELNIVWHFTLTF